MSTRWGEALRPLSVSTHRRFVPQAVSVADEEIPNIYETANVSANTITFSNFHTSKLDATSNMLIAHRSMNQREELTIVEVVNEHIICVGTEIAGKDVFVWDGWLRTSTILTRITYGI